jgi:hypothetical protein
MRRDRALGLSLLAVFTVLVVHSLAYSGFFEDPLTWGAVGLAAASLRLAPVEAVARRTSAAPAASTGGDGAGPRRDWRNVARRGAMIVPRQERRERS